MATMIVHRKPTRRIGEKVKSTPVRKPRTATLTPTEFLELPLSSAIYQVIEDVKLMISKGVKMDMAQWWKKGKRNTIPCSVCLGGAALCSFAPSKVNGFGFKRFATGTLHISEFTALRIAGTFDRIRVGNIEGAFQRWYGASYPEVPAMMRGLNTSMTEMNYWGAMTAEEVREMLIQLKVLAGKLEKEGY